MRRSHSTWFSLVIKITSGLLYALYPLQSAIMRSATAHLRYGNRNLAALTYKLLVDGNPVLSGRLPIVGFQQNIPNIGKEGHSERILLRELETLAKLKSSCSVVMEIYTERTPCTAGGNNCDTALSTKATDQESQIKVYSIALAGMLGRENPQDILNAYARLELYNTRSSSWLV